MAVTQTATTRDPLAFLPGVAEKLGWYVYALRDPRKRSRPVFYVGKGVGNRVYQHARQARQVPGESVEALKLSTIRAINAEGRDVLVEIIRHQLPSEAVAYEVEAAVIDVLRLSGSRLSNIASGHGRARGWRPLEEIVVEYAARKVKITEPVVLIRIAREYRPGMSDRALYSVTRDWWKMDPIRHKPEYAFAVAHGIVRAVYRLHRWVQEPPCDRPRRWRFFGERDPEMEERYFWADVRAALPDGAQNPIRYINC